MSELKHYVVTVESLEKGAFEYGKTGISMHCQYKTEKGAFGYGKRLLNKTFYGEEKNCEIIVELVEDYNKRVEKNKTLSQRIEESEIKKNKAEYKAFKH